MEQVLDVPSVIVTQVDVDSVPKFASPKQTQIRKEPWSRCLDVSMVLVSKAVEHVLKYPRSRASSEYCNSSCFFPRFGTLGKLATCSQIGVFLVSRGCARNLKVVQTLSQERGHHGIAQVSSQCLIGSEQLSKLMLRLLNTCCLISWNKDISPSSECGRESASETIIQFERTVEVPLKCPF